MQGKSEPPVSHNQQKQCLRKFLSPKDMKTKESHIRFTKFCNFCVKQKKIWQLFSGTNFEKCVYIDAFGAKITWPETK